MFGLGRRKRATKYPRCPKCKQKGWVAKTRAELTHVGDGMRVRQGFDCPNCRVRATLARMLHEDKWEFSAPVY